MNPVFWEGHQWSRDSYKTLLLLTVAAPIASQPHVWMMNEQLTRSMSFFNQLRVSVSPDFILAIGADKWDYNASAITRKWWVFKKGSYSVQCQVSWVWLFICSSVCVSSLFCCFLHMAAYRPPWTSSSSCLNKKIRAKKILKMKRQNYILKNATLMFLYTKLKCW